MLPKPSNHHISTKWFYDKAIWAWAGYDAAASGFTTVVMVSFFPVLFKDYWSHGANSLITTARLGTLVSIASLVVALTAPFLGTMADRQACKRQFLLVFSLIAILGCLCLPLIQQDHWMWAASIYAVTLFGYYAANTFYDSLLPGIVKHHSPELISSFGYSMGYLGGGILMLIAVVLVNLPQLVGTSDKILVIKICFVVIALWWLLLLIFTYKGVPEAKEAQTRTPLISLFIASWQQLWSTIKNLHQHRDLAWFLLAYWFFIDAVFSVIVMAVDYGISIGFKPSQLIVAILITQFIGFPSAIIWGMVGRRIGCKKIIIGAIVLYTFVVVWASQMHHIADFFFLAGLVGIGQGAIQALSRAMVAKMIPDDNSAAYFGFFNCVNKFSAIIGPFLMGWSTVLLHSHREGILSLLVLLLMGLVFLLKVREPTR